MVESEKHVLGLSGGRDSAALAVYMRQHHPTLTIEYFFTDTGKELPEVYEYLGRLEGFLGKPILRLNPERDFDFWLKQYNDFLPSPQTRWCTRQLKLRPFEQWIRPILDEGIQVYSYIAIRADEEYREGYSSKNDNLIIRLPFKEAGIDKPGVLEILEAAGLGLPKYYAWRTRSGCTFASSSKRSNGCASWINIPKHSRKRRRTRRTPWNTAHRSPGAKESRWKSWHSRRGSIKSSGNTSGGSRGCAQRSCLTPCGLTANLSISMICTGKRRSVWRAINRVSQYAKG